MKNNRPHRIPYSELTASILATLPTEGLLFSARGKDTPFNGFSKSTAKLYALCDIPPFTLHAFRRTYATILQSQGVRARSHGTSAFARLRLARRHRRPISEALIRTGNAVRLRTDEAYLSTLVGGNGAG